MRKCIAMLVLALSLFACSWQANPTHHYDLDIEPSFTGEEYAMIIEAADRWTTATDGFITFGLIGYQGDPTTIDIHGMSVADLQAKFRPHLAGITLYTGGENTHVYLSNDVDAKTFEHVAEHELGHSLGLEHTGPGTVMCRDNGCASQDITCADVEQFCHIWGCDSTSMSICQAQN